ncbi:spore germination protein [Anaerospora sp.]|uniref:spore germination protein n=1 Tax=Anaerospora sp. TaxID=1960278 RepID=UPI0028A032D1|nr:spore germination protein [Anaerospora sp.]MDF2928690.1 GerA spore germination protein [Anaerospora sp.]
MGNTIITQIYESIKTLLIYKPPQNPKPFVLDEIEKGKSGHSGPRPEDGITSAVRELKTLVDYSRRLEEIMEKSIAAFRGNDLTSIERLPEEVEALKKVKDNTAPVLLSYDAAAQPLDKLVSPLLEENKAIIDRMYSSDINKDILIRRFELGGKQPIKAMLVFLDGMIDKQVLDLGVLQPLMLLDTGKTKPAGNELLTTIMENCLPSNQASPVSKFKDVADAINGGDTALFLEGVEQALTLSTKGYKQRGVERPQIEQSIRGSQAAFSEGLRTNTGLLRTMLPTNDLVTEILMIGDRIPQKCAVMYLKSLVNPDLVAEVKRRLKGISTDYIVDLGILEQFIEDHPAMIFPQMLSTERVDRAAVNIAEGRVALVYEGVPFVHIVPVTFFSFFHSVEDFSLKPPAGTFMRLLRIVGTLVAVILPSMYLGINYFHQEALPTELALAIAGAREKVPFPAIVEILMMEFSFELIREAGLRVPGLLGSSIGIVGAIILGQAAVAANLVSPIMVVIIAVTGLASFSIPDYRLAFALRITRFAFLLLSAMMGLVGLSFGLLVITVAMCSMKSFGVPYMTPVAPKTISGYDTLVRGPVFRQEIRPDQLNTQDSRRQPAISRKWTKEKPVGKKEEEE